MPLQLTVRLPSPLASQLSRFARKLQLKRSNIVRLALQRLFEANWQTEESGTLYDRVLPLIGSVKSGLTDLGQNHRQHLLKKIKNA